MTKNAKSAGGQGVPNPSAQGLKIQPAATQSITHQLRSDASNNQQNWPQGGSKGASNEFRRETARLLKASYYFLLREQARRAWLIFAACIAFSPLPLAGDWPEV